jgi:hypothetical protein
MATSAHELDIPPAATVAILTPAGRGTLTRIVASGRAEPPNAAPSGSATTIREATACTSDHRGVRWQRRGSGAIYGCPNEEQRTRHGYTA